MRRLGPALGERDFKLWWLALLGMGLSLQMVEVAIGWEVYAQHRSALDLGWIGLAEFVPLFVLALPAGQLADVLPRRLIFAGSLLLGVGIGVGLALVSASGDTSVIPYLALAVGAGIAMALGTPAARAMPPTLVGPELLQSAMTLRSIATQSAQMVGPAIGGLLGAAVVTRRPIGRRAGRVLLNVVFLDGASIVVFGLSRSTRCPCWRWASAGSSTSTA